jgi:peptidyl-prolyl cis-trans isomerase B (cyclophilin B)
MNLKSMKKILFFLLMMFSVSVFAQEKTSVSTTKVSKTPKIKKSKTDFLFTLTTQYGDISFILYDKTPKHKANFLKLTQEKFYDDLLFHRVIKDFMIQGGDPNSRTAAAGAALGNGDGGYMVDAEFDATLFHKKGVIAAARDGNPAKASSSCQFYIVQGKKVDDNMLNQIETRGNFKYTSAQREIYKTVGGTPFLDQNYTVYGEVLKGIEVVDKVADEPGDSANRPTKDIRMKIKAEKMKKSKITKMFGYKYI